jgi:tetratricopeptide (TPR) repeat protein
MFSRQGSLQEALSLARKAIALFEQDFDARNLSRLRTELATMQLRLDPPEAAEAKAILEVAAREMDWTSASPMDKASNLLALARANLMLGDAETASEQSASSYRITREQSPLWAAEALVLQGQIAASQRRTAEAATTYKEAILLLSGVGADRRAAELWFELGGLLQDVGESGAALDAYRRAAASTGLTPRAVLPDTRQRVEQLSERSIPLG